VAQTEAQTRPWKQHPHTFRRAVKAISEHPSDAIGWLLLGCRTLKLPIGLRQSRCTGLLGVPQVLQHPAADNGGQVRFGGETATVLLVGQDVDRQWETASGQHGH
jgi:hypothetical protein